MPIDLRPAPGPSSVASVVLFVVAPVLAAPFLATCDDAGRNAAARPTHVASPAVRATVHGPGEGDGFVESFDGTELDSRWTPLGSVALHDGTLVLDGGGHEGAPRDAGLGAVDAVDPSRPQLWTFCVRYTGPPARATWVRLSGSRGELRVVGDPRPAGRGVHVEVEEAGASSRCWSPGAGWGPCGEPALVSGVVDEYFVVGLELDAGRARVLAWNRAAAGRGFDQGYRLFLTTDWIEWSAADASASLWLGAGPGSAPPGVIDFEWVRFATGPEVHAWVNGKATAQGSYDTRHWRSFDGERFVPVDDATPALPTGSGDAWDNHYAKDAWIVQDDDGLYYLFHSGKKKGGAYSIGVARSANVGGPWVKYEGSPILAHRPGTEESGLQFPAVVKDASHPDPEWRWQMLYDGYSFEPVRHAMFLATAPHPLGPWTRRGVALGSGAPGDFDEVGPAGGIPLWWNGQWEVWYPGLRELGETGVWSVGRAVGPGLDQLRRDGHGPRVTQASAAEARLVGEVRGRFLPLDDTSGFRRDGVVLVTDDAVKNNYVTSRVRRVLPDGIELYHSVRGFSPETLTVVRQFDRASLWPRHIARVGDEWWLYLNLFGTFRGAEGGLQTFDENTALLKHGAADPAGATFEFDWMANPPIARGTSNNDRSSENIALVTRPVVRE